MNRQEVLSAINDFRRAFREDLGTAFEYGIVTEEDRGFSIDKRKTKRIEWVGETEQYPLYCTLQTTSKEELIEAGLSTNCTGIVTCIYEDILALQPRDGEGRPKIIRDKILKDVLKIKLSGMEQQYHILDFSFAFQLRDSYIFMKFGIGTPLGEEVYG